MIREIHWVSERSFALLYNEVLLPFVGEPNEEFDDLAGDQIASGRVAEAGEQKGTVSIGGWSDQIGHFGIHLLQKAIF